MLYVADVSGPPIDLVVGGSVVASVPCSGYLKVTPGSGGGPPLPRSPRLRRRGDGVLKHFEVTMVGGFTLLLLGDEVALGQFGTTGPSQDPNACARWAAPPASTPPSPAAAIDQARAGQIASDYFATAHGPGTTLTGVRETDKGITNYTACGPRWEV